MTAPIDAYITASHHEAHLRPIIDALPEERRGRIYAPSNYRREYGHREGICYDPIPSRIDAPLLVAGYENLHRARRPHVLVGHGAMQTYLGIDSGSYAGGPGHEGADLFLYPRQESIDRELARYPGKRGVAVGAPKLDGYLQIPKPRNDKPVIAWTHHWDCRLCPESGWAWPTWRDALKEVQKHYTVLGHAHPRARRQLEPWYAEHRVEMVRDVEELLARADLLVADSTSLGYEWAACDRPVVWLDDASWRLDVEHGLRFWEHIPGYRVWANAGLPGLLHGLERSLDEDNYRGLRKQVSRFVYGENYADGRASERAAAAVLALEAERAAA